LKIQPVAAITIQKIARGACVRWNIELKQICAKVIQKAYRAHIEKRKLYHMWKQGIKIQHAWRIYHAKKKIEDLGGAARKIQKIAIPYLQKKKLKALNETQTTLSKFINS